MLLSPKRSDLSPISLGWSVLGSRTKKRAGATVSSKRKSLLAARICFAIEGLRDRCRATNFTAEPYFYFELATLGSDLEQLANMNIPCGLDGLLVRLNPAEFTGSGG